MSSSISTSDRFRGCLLGLAAGDALGTTLEFSPPGSFDPIDDMVGGGPFGLQAGQWTDDTSMALCLATSLLESGGFDPEDQMRRYVRWYREGYMSSTGSCFDIGGTTSTALTQLRADGRAVLRTDRPDVGGKRLADAAGSGSHALRQATPPQRSRPARTARAPPTAPSRRSMPAATSQGCWWARSEASTRQTLLSEHYSPVTGVWDANPLAPKIAEIAGGSFKRKQPPEIRGTGYVVDSLEAVLWAFHHTQGFAEGALKVVNLGHDADTTGAIYGQIAGAHYGAESIPSHWRQRLAMGDEIASLADRLHDRAFQH